MPLTAPGFAAAFTTADERDLFLERCANGAKIAPGTTFRHVLACNVGIWGDRYAFKMDAAKIMAHELDRWADAAGEDRLELPPDLVMRSRAFDDGFRRCAAINEHAVDTFVAKFSRAAPRPGAQSPEVPHECLAPDYTARIYYELAPLADRFAKITKQYQDDIGMIGYEE